MSVLSSNSTCIAKRPFKKGNVLSAGNIIATSTSEIIHHQQQPIVCGSNSKSLIYVII